MATDRAESWRLKSIIREKMVGSLLVQLAKWTGTRTVEGEENFHVQVVA